MSQIRRNDAGGSGRCAGWRGGELRILPGYRARHRIQSLLQNPNPHIEPVSIAVERVDRRCQPPGFALGLFGDLFDLLRLPRQVGGSDLLMPHSKLACENGRDHRADRTNRPGSEPPQRPPVEFILLGQEPGKHAVGALRLQTLRQIAGILCHGKFRVLTESTQTLTGNVPSSLIRARYGCKYALFHPVQKRFMTAHIKELRGNFG